ncbi:DNA-directed RNA polymerase subunit beta' [Labeo rohita]|uniref:DNA-directed RNA polymerase subunit beta n=1 Tax=Labeo rohita TaxID=84645 RepID=A0ABQ8MKW6_LABRO|nr:DNA-directed RNA polymerase subunit beta' [Labeo rohita]
MSARMGKSGESRLCYNLCVPHCKCYITSRDTHSMCMTLHSGKALFEKGDFTSVPHGAGPASAEVEWLLHSWGLQLNLLEGMETGDPLSPSSPARSTACSEVDVESMVNEPLPQSPQYEELLEVVTRAVAKLNIDWAVEEKAEPQRSKLDERFLRRKPRWSLPFFPNLHTEVSRLWVRPFSAHLLIPASDYYGNVAPTFPSNPLHTTSPLVGKRYTAAGQAGTFIHTISVLQAYQADLLKELDEGEEVNVLELLGTADLALHATKETTRGHWVVYGSSGGSGETSLEKDSVFLLDIRAPLHKLAHQILCGPRGKGPVKWMLHPKVVKQICRVFGPAQADLFATRENAQCPLWCSLTHPVPLGLDAMVQTWQRLRLYAFPPIALLPGVLERVRWDGVSLLLIDPYWRGRVWFSDLISLLNGSPWEIAVRRDLLPQAGDTILHLRLELWKLWSRALSTRKLFALKWRLFTSWYGDHPVNCPIGTVLKFLQACFSTGLTHSTLKVYVAAILAYHTPLGGLSVGKNPLVTRFLRGVLRPPVRHCVPTWDPAVVFEALCRPPFEPIEDISDRWLTIKTALLLALSFGDLQALSVAPSYLDFHPGLAKAFLYARAGFVPKISSAAPQPVVLHAFCPPPFREPDQQKLNCMCLS